MLSLFLEEMPYNKILVNFKLQSWPRCRPVVTARLQAYISCKDLTFQGLEGVGVGVGGGSWSRIPAPLPLSFLSLYPIPRVPNFGQSASQERSNPESRSVFFSEISDPGKYPSTPWLSVN